MIKRNPYIILVSLLWCGLAWAQQPEPVDRETAVIETGFGYQMWKVQPNYRPITQISMPFSLLFPLGAKMTLNIANTPAYSWWVDDRKILGLSDTWIQANYEIQEDRLMLNAGICLPTGKTRLDTNQYVLSKEMLSRNIFQYRLPLYGQGFSMKMGIMYAIPLTEQAMLGLGGQYIKRRPYHPVVYEYTYKSLNGQDMTGRWDSEYQPGDEATFQVGVDFLATKNLRLSVDGLYTYYWRDRLAGEEVYGAGGKLTLNADAYYRYALEKYVWVHSTFRSRGKNELLQGASFKPEAVNSNGPQLEVNIEANVISDDSNGLRLLAVTRYFAKSQLEDSREEMVFGAGVGSILSVAESIEMLFRFQYLFGEVRTDLNRRLIGLETFVGFRYRF